MSQYDKYYPKVLPWSQIIIDLREAGVGPFQVARLIDAKWSTFQAWGDQVEPRHSYGLSILSLHTEHCGEELTLQRISEASQKINN